MAKISLKIQGRESSSTDSDQRGGARINRWADDDELIGDIPRSKKKSLLANESQVQDQGATMPHDYIDKMHVSKSNWLGRMNRQGEAR